MKISWRESEFECSNCGRPYPGSRLDRRLWCPECRGEVIRRATRVGRVVGLATVIILSLWIYTMVGPTPRFLVVYVVMIVAAYFFLFKLTRRVAFEVIRGRGVPPPLPREDG
ncbi:MAG: hypothetical protein GEU90_10375 [Gemmatimonas sp.]|nr:hypothetical protein [Gemmatimonas sp.]